MTSSKLASVHKYIGSGNLLLNPYPGMDDYLVNKAGNPFRRKGFRILLQKALAGNFYFVHCNDDYESLQLGAFRDPLLRPMKLSF